MSAKVETRRSGLSLDGRPRGGRRRDGRVSGLRGAAQRRAAGAILMQRSTAALWRVARARGGRGWLLVGLEDAGTRGGVTRRVTKCDVLELKSPRGKALEQSAVPERQQAVTC